VDPRHAAVDLRDDHTGRFGGGLHDVDADAHAQVAVLVGRGGLEKRHVDVLEAPAEQAGHLGEVDRRIVGHPPVDRPAGAVADEEGVVPEIGLELLVGIGGHAEGANVKHLGVEEGLGVFLDVSDQRVDEVLGLGAGRRDEDRVAPVDVPEDLLLRREFPGMPLLPEVEELRGVRHGRVSLSAFRY